MLAVWGLRFFFGDCKQSNTPTLSGPEKQNLNWRVANWPWKNNLSLAGTLMIAPALLTHVKDETEREVQLAKNIRKAKEERELANKKGGKKQKEESP